jgi:hypothetical protein
MKPVHFIPIAAIALASALAREPVDVLPVSRWHIESRDGDRVELKDEEGVLGIHFDVNVDTTYQLGHMNFKQADFRLQLTEPVALADDQTRVMFESKGFIKQRNRSGALQMMPLIRDESGEILIYEPYPSPHLRNCTDKWCKWTTRHFYGAEAGGATQNIFQPELEPKAGDGNAWPDGKLTFIGFEVQVRPAEFKREQGALCLAGVDFGGLRLPAEDPYGYADAFFSEAGDYTLAAEVRNAFQYLPVREFRRSFTYQPNSLASQRQRLTFPLGPNGNYWIDYQITDAQGGVVASEAMRYEVEGNPDAALPEAVDPTRPPAIGVLRINPDRPKGGVYEALPMPVQIRVFPGEAKALILDWTLVAYPAYLQGKEAVDQVIEKGKAEVRSDGNPYVDHELVLKGETRRDAYRLLLAVNDGDRVVDRREYVLGRRTDFSKPYDSRQGLIRGRDYVKRSPYFRTTCRPDSAASEDDAVRQFETYLDEATQMARYLTYMVDMKDLEILPGVYDFAALDRIMDAAADRGAAMTVRLAHVDNYGPYRWLPFSRQVNYDGTTIFNHFYGNYMPADPEYLAAWKRANRALYDRYKTHPGFQGYYVMEAGGESMILDKPWLGVVSGYSAMMQKGFRDYLQHQLKLDLGGLNARWKTTFPDWGSVVPPDPDFRLGASPDLRLEWLDFCRFKTYLNNRFWFQTLTGDIRSYDKDRVVIAYNVHDLDGLLDKIDYTHGGGVMKLPANGERIALWEKHRIGNCQEPHHPHRWNSYAAPYLVDWCLYTEMSRSGAGGLNLHVYYNPPGGGSGPLYQGYAGHWGYDRYEHFKPIYRELHGATMLTSLSKDVAICQDPTTLFTKHRTVFPHRKPDLARWFELLKYQGVEYEKLQPERLGEYKLVLPNLLDEVVSLETVEMLDGYVRQGGKIVISALTGRYCPETGTDPFVLLKRLGIDPPAGEYVQTGLEVKATATTASPLLDAGQAIPFYTREKLRHDPTTKSVQSRFFQWPFRWIPLTDYFGHYRDNKTTNGDVWARFGEGGVAMSRHTVGKGEVVVLWGVPDYWPENLPGFMKRAAKWAGVEQKAIDNPIPLMMECQRKTGDKVERHYALVWCGEPRFGVKPGTYRQKLPNAPDGTWFIDDMVTGRRYGWYRGDELREQGIDLTFEENNSALQVVRLVPGNPVNWPDWGKRYRQLDEEE